jgi:hypothetical protein
VAAAIIRAWVLIIPLTAAISTGLFVLAGMIFPVDSV